MEQAVLSVFWKMLDWKARDMTAAASERSCLVLAPHPDDETLGCGGVIMQKLAAGARVEVVVATDGGASHLDDPARKTSRQDLVAMREQETRLACAELGLAAEHVSFLGFPDGALMQHADDLREQLAAAVRLAGAAHWEYPVWSFDFRSWPPPGRTNKAGYVLGVLRMLRMVLVSSVPLRGLQERKALGCHRSQLGLLEAEPDWPEGAERHRIPEDRLNGASTAAWLRARAPRLLAVAGSPILGAGLLAVPSDGTLNMHSSLLPRYRGTRAEFWQVHNGDLDCAGITINFVDASVDGGDIVRRHPLNPEPGDSPWLMRARNQLGGLSVYPETLCAVLEGRAARCPQPPVRERAYRFLTSPTRPPAPCCGLCGRPASARPGRKKGGAGGDGRLAHA